MGIIYNNLCFFIFVDFIVYDDYDYNYDYNYYYDDYDFDYAY